MPTPRVNLQRFKTRICLKHPGHLVRLIKGAGVRKYLKGGAMVKKHGRPSLQYRYEHYDPR